MDPRTPEDGFRLDVSRVRRSFGRAAADYDRVAVLQQRVRDELLERLDVVRLQPEVVVDLGAGTGQATLALKRRYPRARVVAVDIAEGMLAEAGRRQTLLRRFGRVCGDAAAIPVRSGCADIVFSNLMLQWANDPDVVLRECRRILRPGGLLTFTTFGPDTLVELRRAWSAADGRTHVNRFVDMHDLGDALLRCGMAEPVMDVDRVTLTYGDARGLMRDLKAIGAHNANEGRSRGLTGKAALSRMLAAYETRRRPDGQLPATYEVVYGHAWAPDRPPSDQAPRLGGEVSVPVSTLRRRT